jgi:protein TonB
MTAKKSNLENKRTVFFQIGLVITLSIVLLAFEWTTVRTNRNILTAWDGVATDEEMAEITIHKEKKPPMPVPKITPIIIPVDNDAIDMDDDPFVDAEPKKGDYNDLNREIPDIIEIEPEDEIVHVYVQISPEFPGGEPALFQYLAANLKYTKMAKEIGLQGKMLVSFVVWKDGTIGDIKIIRGLGAGLDEEAIRVIQSMPRWKPGNQNGRNVNVEFNMPVQFKLK